MFVEPIKKHFDASVVAVRVDPHDGACHGAHDIVVEAFSTGGQRPHVTLSWQGSALLSIRGTKEFRDALTRAIEIAERIDHTGVYKEE